MPEQVDYQDLFELTFEMARQEQLRAERAEARVRQLTAELDSTIKGLHELIKSTEEFRIAVEKSRGWRPWKQKPENP